jgi:hypothetical protein
MTLPFTKRTVAAVAREIPLEHPSANRQTETATSTHPVAKRIANVCAWQCVREAQRQRDLIDFRSKFPLLISKDYRARAEFCRPKQVHEPRAIKAYAANGLEQLTTGYGVPSP